MEPDFVICYFVVTKITKTKFCSEITKFVICLFWSIKNICFLLFWSTRITKFCCFVILISNNKNNKFWSPYFVNQNLLFWYQIKQILLFCFVIFEQNNKLRSSKFVLLFWSIKFWWGGDHTYATMVPGFEASATRCSSPGMHVLLRRARNWKLLFW